MRKTISGALVVVSLGLSLLLVGCGGGSPSPNSTPPSGYSVGPALLHALPVRR
jgi:hypothetical protein